MEKYELTVIVDTKITPAKKKAVLKKLEDLLKVFKGSILKTNDWGVVEFAYKISKKTSGSYLNFDIELGSTEAAKLPSKLNLEGDIYRYLLVRKVEKKIKS